jgi:hypothetical protein
VGGGSSVSSRRSIPQVGVLFHDVDEESEDLVDVDTVRVIANAVQLELYDVQEAQSGPAEMAE